LAETEKVVFEETVKCAHCGKLNTVKKLRKITRPAEKAEYDERVVVEKAMVDSRLDGAEEE
jgi:disulfide oxidoreductase YuzD